MVQNATYTTRNKISVHRRGFFRCASISSLRRPRTLVSLSARASPAGETEFRARSLPRPRRAPIAPPTHTARARDHTTPFRVLEHPDPSRRAGTHDSHPIDAIQSFTRPFGSNPPIPRPPSHEHRTTRARSIEERARVAFAPHRARARPSRGDARAMPMRPRAARWFTYCTHDSPVYGIHTGTTGDAPSRFFLFFVGT